MYRGTTPTITLTAKGLSELTIRSMYLTIKQANTVIEKTLSDMTVEGDSIKVSLSQPETLSFTAGSSVLLQLRVLAQNSTAYATNVLKIPVEGILKDGEIT